MSKLLSQGGFGCIYYPGIKCSGKPQDNKNIVTKLQKNDESSDNEIDIGQVIMSIQNYKMYFLPVINSCPVNLRSIDKKILKDCRVIDKDKDKDKYILMEIPYVANKSFYTILIDMYASKKHIIVGLIETYTYLLEAIGILLSKQIVHFDIKSENILYNQNTHLPLILDFGVSIQMDMVLQMDKMNIKKYFYTYSPDYYIWALEIHVINYLLHEMVKEQDFRETDVKNICAEYVKHNKGLINFSQDFKRDYLRACETYLLTYVGREKAKIIQTLLVYYPTWDNYSLSVLYLKTLSFMFPHGFHKNTLIIYFSQMLLYNIHPDPTKRYSLEETKKKFGEIFFMEEHIDNYMDLIDTFEYDIDYTTKAIQADLHQLSRTKGITKRS
uniref:Protein kinase domain-containing protein n=1 Tax=viral metagenome TaxID=1070528 RepID=A0A6C0IN48_9ZZZZ